MQVTNYLGENSEGQILEEAEECWQTIQIIWWEDTMYVMNIDNGRVAEYTLNRMYTVE